MHTFHIKRRRNRHILLLVEIEPYIKRAHRGPKAPHSNASYSRWRTRRLAAYKTEGPRDRWPTRPKDLKDRKILAL